MNATHKRKSSRQIASFVAAMALASSLALSLAVPAHAQGRWCAEAGGRNAYQNCGYYTYQQCRAAVSGVGGFCRPDYQANPYVGNEGYSGELNDGWYEPPREERRWRR